MDMNDLMRQMGRMRKDMDSVTEELKERYVEAESGSGLIEVIFNGQQDLVKLAIDPKVVQPGSDGKVDIELLEDLIVAAVSQGIEQSKALMREEMNKVTGGLGGAMPGLF
jgi:DNA-binding YbaB/EbfC family protein